VRELEVCQYWQSKKSTVRIITTDTAMLLMALSRINTAANSFGTSET
jgi:hypothetical protein